MIEIGTQMDHTIFTEWQLQKNDLSVYQNWVETKFTSIFMSSLWLL